MALPCLGRLCPSALREAPTGALTQAAARNYDPDNRGAAMLRDIDAFVNLILGEADRAVGNAQENVNFYRQHGMQNELEHAQIELMRAELERREEYARVLPEAQQMREEVRLALERGEFAVPFDRQQEDLRIQEERLARATDDLNRGLSANVHAHARARALETPPSSPSRDYSMRDEQVDEPMDRADEEMDESMRPADSQESLIRAAVARGEFSYDGMSFNAENELLTFGNRPLAALSNREFGLLFQQYEIHLALADPAGTGLPAPSAEEVGLMNRFLAMAPALQWPRSISMTGQAPSGQLIKLCAEFRSWLAAPPSVVPRGPESVVLAEPVAPAAVAGGGGYPALTSALMSSTERRSRIDAIARAVRRGETAWARVVGDGHTTLTGPRSVAFRDRLLERLSDRELSALHRLVEIDHGLHVDEIDQPRPSYQNLDPTVVETLIGSVSALLRQGFWPDSFRSSDDPNLRPILDLYAPETMDQQLRELARRDPATLVRLNAVGDLWFAMPFDVRPSSTSGVVIGGDEMRDVVRHAIFMGFKTESAYPPGPFFSADGIERMPDELSHLPHDDLKALFEEFEAYSQLPEAIRNGPRPARYRAWRTPESVAE
jgi:hypothetical protein